MFVVEKQSSSCFLQETPELGKLDWNSQKKKERRPDSARREGKPSSIPHRVDGLRVAVRARSVVHLENALEVVLAECPERVHAARPLERRHQEEPRCVHEAGECGAAEILRRGQSLGVAVVKDGRKRRWRHLLKRILPVRPVTEEGCSRGVSAVM